MYAKKYNIILRDNKKVMLFQNENSKSEFGTSFLIGHKALFGPLFFEWHLCHLLFDFVLFFLLYLLLDIRLVIQYGLLVEFFSHVFIFEHDTFAFATILHGFL